MKNSLLYTLENDKLLVTASTRGGELHSLTARRSETEYLWSGDAAYWKYHAPILFPIVGRVADGQYHVNGKTYQLPSHGFARTSAFTCTAHAKDKLTFTLHESAATRAVYPFRFSLQITYTLLENSVKTHYSVKNTDENPIFFSIGGHPAFMCPIDPNENLEDCYLSFSEKETASIFPIAPNGLIAREKQPYLENTDTLPLRKELFHNDALIFHRLKSKTVTIRSKNHTKALSVDISEFPFLGIWAPAKGAPFLCIEPWFGHTDFDGFNGEFKDKEDNVSLAPGETFAAAYTVTAIE